MSEVEFGCHTHRSPQSTADLAAAKTKESHSRHGQSPVCVLHVLL